MVWTPYSTLKSGQKEEGITLRQQDPGTMIARFNNYMHSCIIYDYYPPPLPLPSPPFLLPLFLLPLFSHRIHGYGNACENIGRQKRIFTSIHSKLDFEFVRKIIYRNVNVVNGLHDL